MIIHVNKTKNIYPNVNPMAPQKPKAYRLIKLTETDACFLDENENYERLEKTMKTINTIKNIVVAGLVTSIVITGGVSIVVFSIWCWPDC